MISVIGVDFDRRLLRLDRLDVAHPDMLVQLTEMQHGRDFRGLVGHPDEEARKIGRRAIGQRSAEAEAGDRDLADLSDRLACGGDVHPVAAYLTWQGRMLENNGIAPEVFY